MKNIKIFAIGAALTLGLASCSDSYFNPDMDQNKTSETAFNTAQDVKNGVIGTYYALGNYRFYGNYVVALGDMAADIATASSSTGHFFAINSYGITDTNGELDDIWNYGYKVIDRSTRTTPATEDWSSYINEVAESETEMAFGSYFFRVGDEVATVAANYRQMTFSYTDEEGVANSIEAPYIVRPNAIHFYNPVSIFGKTITDLTYVGGEDYLFTSNDPEAQMNGYVPPVSEALTSGNWYICYANLSAAIQQYWDYAAPRLLAKEGEKLGYAYLSGNEQRSDFVWPYLSCHQQWCIWKDVPSVEHL